MIADRLSRLLQPAEKVRYPLSTPVIVFTAVTAAVVSGALFFAAATTPRGELLAVAGAGIVLVALCVMCGAFLARRVAVQGASAAKNLGTYVLAGFAGLLLVALGIFFGQAVFGPMQRDSLRNSNHHRDLIILTMKDAGRDGELAMLVATRIDASVRDWARDKRDADASILASAWRGLPVVSTYYRDCKNALAMVALRRIEALSGNARLWAPTAGICEELRNARPEYKKDVSWYRPGEFMRNGGLAEDYALLLGRPVNVEQLMPRIPDGRCD